uniref:Peroxisome assembly protein 12 n=1 Tax=Meloidogyne hapla TaxID=6305 RepID=A0A1I8BED3_MELHA
MNNSNDGTITVLSTNRQSNKNDASLPSIFDYMAQDSLRTQLKPGILAAIKVVLPFIAERITKLYANIKNNSFGLNNIFGWRRLLLSLFPHLRAFHYFSIILFQIGYTFSFIKIPSLLLLISGVRLEILNSDDFARIELNNGRKNTLSFLARCWRLLFWLPSTIGRILSLALFLIQFLEIFYKDELGIELSKIINGNNNLINFNEFPINKLPIDQQSLCRAGKCPICRQKRNDEAVLSISGYIFCYSCIYKFIILNGRCPVTSLPATTNEIIKIYR